MFPYFCVVLENILIIILIRSTAVPSIISYEILAAMGEIIHLVGPNNLTNIFSKSQLVQPTSRPSSTECQGNYFRSVNSLLIETKLMEFNLKSDPEMEPPHWVWVH